MKKVFIGIVTAGLGLLVGCESPREDRRTANAVQPEYQSVTNPSSQLPGVGTGSPNTSPNQTPPR